MSIKELRKIASEIYLAVLKGEDYQSAKIRLCMHLSLEDFSQIDEVFNSLQD